MSYDRVVVRKSMMAETFGARLLASKEHSLVLQTDNVQDFDDTLLEQLKGQRVLLVGNYFSRSMHKLTDLVTSVTVFLNSADQLDAYPTISAEENKGFVSWVCSQYEFEPYIVRMAGYLDSYLYGFISAESVLFQNGVYARPGADNNEKICSIQSMEEVNATLDAGNKPTENKMQIAKERLVDSQIVTWKGYQIVIGHVPSEIVLTCTLFAVNSPSGIGMGYRYAEVEVNGEKKDTHSCFLPCNTTIRTVSWDRDVRLHWWWWK